MANQVRRGNRRATGWTTAGVLVGAWVATGLVLGSCASNNVQASSCEDHDECNPGYHCYEGECVSGNPDGGPPDAFYIPPSDALPPDANFLCAEIDFTMTETQELFEVPANVRYMHVKAWGAGGNGELGCSYGNGGRGGYSEAVFEVVPGTSLIVIVGKRGRAGMTGEEIVRFGFGNWGGGGLSGIFLGPVLAGKGPDAFRLALEVIAAVLALLVVCELVPRSIADRRGEEIVLALGRAARVVADCTTDTGAE